MPTSPAPRLALATLVLASAASAQSTGELERALATVAAHVPVKGSAPDGAVAAARDLLEKALPKLVGRNDPVAARLAELAAARQDLEPTKATKVGPHDPLRRVLVRWLDITWQRTAAADVRAAATAAEFPGVPAADAAVERRTCRIDLAVPGRHSLGLYAAPGALVTVAPTGAVPEQLRVRIGAHSDDIARRDSWPRLPRITRTFPLAAPATTAACAFGGLVHVEVPDGLAGELTVEVAGAVAAPLFVLGTTPVDRWRTSERGAPGPWAELATGKVILTVPSAAIRGLDDPTPLLQFWDRALDAAATLAARPLARQRPERYVADLEISAGAMHAGYPIMTHLDAVADMVELARLQQGPWGLFHELGHNHQQKEWTFAGTGEVTVNLFSLYLCETLCGKDIDRAWGGNVLRSKARLAAVLAAGGVPWETKAARRDNPDLSLRLLMYSQLQKAFGWEAFTEVFADYRALAAADKPSTDDARRDQWLMRMSEQVGRNLGPFFVAWGLPTSEQARARVAHLPAWMPEDWPAK